jgi:hypothetical protein
MVSYQYTYLIWVGIFFLIWIALYLWRKDVRKEMLIISFLFGIGGIISEVIHIQDWWQPLTITNTKVGIEDFLIGAFIGGVAAVIYELIYNKKVKIKKAKKKEKFKRNINFYFIAIILLSLFLGSFYFLKINSFYSSIIAFLISTFIIWVKRKDLIKDSIFSGFLLLVIGSVVYYILLTIQPEFINKFWYLESIWYTKLFLGVPIAEYIWYFLAGAFIGPLYEYWQEGKLITLKKKKPLSK